MPTLTTQALERRFSWAVAHDLGSLHRTKKPRRYLRGDMRYGIDSPSGLRPRLNGSAAKARRRSRNAKRIPNNLVVFIFKILLFQDCGTSVVLSTDFVSSLNLAPITYCICNRYSDTRMRWGRIISPIFGIKRGYLFPCWWLPAAVEKISGIEPKYPLAIAPTKLYPIIVATTNDYIWVLSQFAFRRTIIS